MGADLVIYGLVAAGLVFWLRSVLGTRSGDERERPNPFTNAPEQKPAPGLNHDNPVATPGILPGHYEQAAEALDRNMAVDGPQAEQGVAALARADRNFNLPHFLRGAQDAFIMIVEAFAKGDRQTLQDLLAPAVYSGFEGVLQQREKDGHTAAVEIHAVRRVEVLEARIDGRMAYVTVKFVADETNVEKDADGKLLRGHPDRVTETIDIWTFARDMRSRDMSWQVVETREGSQDVPPAGITV